MRAFRLSVLLLAVLFACFSVPSAEAQRPGHGPKPTLSPKGRFVIVQNRHRSGVEQLVRFRNGKTVVLAKSAPRPALFEVSPDDKWIYRQQRIGHGENVAYIYRVNERGFVTPADRTLNDRAISYMKRKADFRPERYFNINVAFHKWDKKNGDLVFEFHASPVRGREKPVDRRLRYNLNTEEVSKD